MRSTVRSLRSAVIRRRSTSRRLGCSCSHPRRCSTHRKRRRRSCCPVTSAAVAFGSFVNAADSKRSSRAPADPTAIDLVSHSSLHTERLGERLAAHAQPGDVIALWGELGTGKTVLARGVAIGLGIDEETVTSPTFIILHEHFGGRLPLYHLDLYRLSQNQLGSTGWEDALEAGGLTAIEWPD